MQDFWAAAEVHVAAFYNKRTPLGYNIAKISRFNDISRSSELLFGRPGRYICLVAKSRMLKEEIEPVQVKDRSLLMAMLRNLYPTAISIGITDNPSERGIYGAMNMDTTGRFIPTLSILEGGRKRRKRPQGCAYFSNLSVLPSARRRGIGTSLIREAERLAKQYGCWGAALHCSPDNRDAFRLYTKEGYLTVEGAQSEKNNCILLAKVF